MKTKGLMELVSKKTQFNLEDVELVFKTLIQEIMNTNQFQENITISGFGSFKIKRVKSFIRTRKKTNTQHKVSSYKYIKFIPDNKYKKHIRTKPPKLPTNDK